VNRTAAVRAVVVEQSPSVRARLVRALQAEGDIAVVGEAATGADAVAMVADVRPDVVTIDLHLQGGGGQFAVEQIMARTPTPILVLSAVGRDDLADPAIEALVGGALGLGLAKLFTLGGDPTRGLLPFFYLPGAAIVAGLGVTLVVGAASGIIPAIGAMRLRVVDALRRV